MSAGVARDLGVRYVLGEASARPASAFASPLSSLMRRRARMSLGPGNATAALPTFLPLGRMNVIASIEPQVYAAESQRLRSRPAESLDAWGCVTRSVPYVWTWPPRTTRPV